MKKLLLLVFIITVIIGIFPRCAKIVSPTGGPKDSLAPVLVRSTPDINSVNFKGEKITLTFNEFIQIKDIQKKLAISPPMTKRPEIIQRGKSIEIKLKEPLKENTTYTIYFADAIVDNNEGNPMHNFVFAFSTGSTIDSLTVSGKIINSFTLAPEENVFVMLYDEHNDSLPIKALPQYLTRSNKQGIFNFSNLQYKDYKVFALVDNNSNYKFDQITEDIAFKSDTLKREVLKNPSAIDTSQLAKREIHLNLFKENNRIQALTGSSRAQRRKLALSFTKKPEGDVRISLLNFNADSSWFINEYSKLQDTVIYWITNNQINAIDTLKIQVSCLKSDSLQRLQPELDTVKFVFKDKEEPKRRKSDKEKEPIKKEYLKSSCSIRNEQIVTPTTSLTISFSEPPIGINYSNISILNLEDSTTLSNIKFTKDSLNPRIYSYNYPWKTDISYKLTILPTAFKSIGGIVNDTIMLKFKGANLENYGVLNITLKNVKRGAIIELLTEKKDKVIERLTAKQGEKVTFNYITPGKYSIRFIEDLNENGIWDTGWYLKGLQPERVFIYTEGKTKGVLNIRANWENEIQFDFDK